jgi:hypothetical protein
MLLVDSANCCKTAVRSSTFLTAGEETAGVADVFIDEQDGQPGLAIQAGQGRRPAG